MGGTGDRYGDRVTRDDRRRPVVGAWTFGLAGPARIGDRCRFHWIDSLGGKIPRVDRRSASLLIWPPTADPCPCAGQSSRSTPRCASESAYPLVTSGRRSSSSTLGSPNANDPLLISPPRSYAAMTTPVLEVVTSTTLSPAGIAPPAKSRFPLPSTTGKVHRWNSSTRSFRRSVWMRLPLPCTWISGPDCFFSSDTYFGTSPLMSVELFHSTFLSVRDAMCLRALFNASAPGSVDCGQYAAKISYVFRPRSISNGRPMHSLMTCPIRASQ